MVKILAVGNSFSEDATALLQLLNPDLFVRNLYIGGCSLERHVDEFTLDNAAYSYEENGSDSLGHFITLKEALLSEKWDYITVQQESGRSGKIETYYPYLTMLLNYIRQFSDAEIVLHETWAYETGSTHPKFVDYNSSTAKMWAAIEKTYAEVSKRENLRVIPVGAFIAALRRSPVFDSDRGGMSITRDGFHLSLNYGRYAAALVWNGFFGGNYPEALRTYPSEPFKVIRETYDKFLSR